MADKNDMNSMAPEEYSELKKQEKAEVFELLSDATQKLLSPGRMKEYADKQAQLFKHSVSNVLLIMEQDPEATWVRSYDDWKADGVTVMKGETGIKTLGSYRFQKEDGTMGMGSKVVKMFDVKQTVIKDFDIESPSYRKVPDVITGIYPASVEVKELPNGELAVYDPDDRLIRVKEGLDPATKVFVVAREAAMYHLVDFHETGREENMAEAELAAYILTEHYGFETPDVDFSKLTETYPGKEEKVVRSELGRIKFACDSSQASQARIYDSMKIRVLLLLRVIPVMATEIIRWKMSSSSAGSSFCACWGYPVRTSAGFNPVSWILTLAWMIRGKRQSLYSSTLEGLRKLEDQLVSDRHAGIKISNNSAKLDDFFKVWCDTKRGIKDNTYNNYKYMYRQFVAPVLGREKVSSIKKSDIKRFYNRIIEIDGVKLSTADNIQTILHQVLQMAVDDNYIRINPSDNALKELKLSHNYDSDKRMALTVEQQRLLMSYLDESESFRHWRPIITVMLGTGMRAGEVTGLRWKDVDLENGTIDVNHTLVFYNKNHKQTYAINTPKTPSSIRTIPMLDSVKEAFLEEKRNQEESGLYCKSIIDGYQDFIFCNRFGEVLNLGVINKALRRIMIDCNEKVWENHEGDDMPLLLPRISCHSFRHTYATRLCESGMNIKVIQGLLGHSDISTTMNIYVDVTKELRDMAMDDLANYLKEKKIS